MVSVISALRYITSVSRNHQRYQSRSSIYIRGLIPWNFAELAEAVPIDHQSENLTAYDREMQRFESCIEHLSHPANVCENDKTKTN